MTIIEFQVLFFLCFSDLGLAFVEVNSKFVDSTFLLCFIIFMKQFILILQLLPNLSWALNVKHFAESEERMFIINTETGQTEKFLVAHGRNSGDLYAEKFSNEENSKMSSLGYYLIEEKY